MPEADWQQLNCVNDNAENNAEKSIYNTSFNLV